MELSVECGVLTTVISLRQGHNLCCVQDAVLMLMAQNMIQDRLKVVLRNIKNSMKEGLILSGTNIVTYQCKRNSIMLFHKIMREVVAIQVYVFENGRKINMCPMLSFATFFKSFHRPGGDKFCAIFQKALCLLMYVL